MSFHSTHEVFVGSMISASVTWRTLLSMIDCAMAATTGNRIMKSRAIPRHALMMLTMINHRLLYSGFFCATGVTAAPVPAAPATPADPAFSPPGRAFPACASCSEKREGPTAAGAAAFPVRRVDGPKAHGQHPRPRTYLPERLSTRTEAGGWRCFPR
jgi:hypothetical protein